MVAIIVEMNLKSKKNHLLYFQSKQSVHGGSCRPN